ncbi:uncharacterized protein C21orf58 homolog [Lissotriton helveticus]
MADPSLVDQMTRLKLKLLEKKLENRREYAEENNDSPMTTARSYDGQEDALQSALLRRKDLLQRLREQHMLEELSRPHTWEGSRRKNYRMDPVVRAPPIQVYHPPPPPPPAEPPRIIQQQWPPQQPATIIQQLPPQQPLITQIPAPQSFPQQRSGSIKEDMVEMMLMQNAQMHQIIMQNMMLKALPPMAFSPAAAPGSPSPQHIQQDAHYAAPVVVRAEKPRPSSVHHHHHYTPPGAPPGPAAMPSFGGYPMWPSMMPSNPMGQTGGFPPTIHHMTGPTATVPAMHTFTMDGQHPSAPMGL